MKSSLFLIEQLMAVLVFAICAALCVSIFAASFLMSNDGRDMNSALVIAKSGAECYKSTLGDIEKTALILGGVCADNEVRVYYDETGMLCEENSAVYILSITRQNAEDSRVLRVGDLSVEKNNGEKILTFSVAARRKPE